MKPVKGKGEDYVKKQEGIENPVAPGGHAGGIR